MWATLNWNPKLCGKACCTGTSQVDGWPEEFTGALMSSLSEPLLLAQCFYRMAPVVAVLRGLDPDRSPHLAKVNETA